MQQTNIFRTVECDKSLIYASSADKTHMQATKVVFSSQMECTTCLLVLALLILCCEMTQVSQMSNQQPI